jgi:hypothetical protein
MTPPTGDLVHPTLPPALLQELMRLAARYHIPFDELQEIALKLYCEGMRRVLTDWQEGKT